MSVLLLVSGIAVIVVYMRNAALGSIEALVSDVGLRGSPCRLAGAAAREVAVVRQGCVATLQDRDRPALRGARVEVESATPVGSVDPDRALPDAGNDGRAVLVEAGLDDGAAEGAVGVVAIAAEGVDEVVAVGISDAADDIARAGRRGESRQCSGGE
jgi:hypothetical protein